MHTKVVVGVALALYALLAFLGSVVMDFYDRQYPQALGVSSEITVDFSQSSLDEIQSQTELRRLDSNYGLGLVKRLPDLDDTGAQVFVMLSDPIATQRSTEVAWFGAAAPSRVVGVDRIADSSVDGSYLVDDSDGLNLAIAKLTAQGVMVERTDATPLASILFLSQEPGFSAPVISASALIVAMIVFWLAVKARSRALRVLAGAPPWRIQGQDLGKFVFLLFASAAGVSAVSAVLAGLIRGWIFVPSLIAIVGVFQGMTLGVTIVAALIMSWASWPTADVFAKRRPAIASLRGVAQVTQAVTLIALIAFAAPAWAAADNAARTARQLEAWNQLSDQVQLAFGMTEESLDLVAPQVARVVSSAEKEGASALSFTVTEDEWQGDFGRYSAVALVNADWIALIAGSSASTALDPVKSAEVRELVMREFGPSFEVWRGVPGSVEETVDSISAFAPAAGVEYPVLAGGGSQLAFLTDVLVLEVPSIASIFDPHNVVSLASSGNIVLSGADATRASLRSEGLDPDGIAALGIEGSLRPIYAAEQGILEGQFATYLAQLLAVSLIALALAFIVAAAVNAMVGGLLNARRDFPLRLSGASWGATIKSRSMRDMIVGAAIGLLVTAAQPAETRVVTLGVAAISLVAIYLSHRIAAPLIFDRVARRML
jgi:hypothetical protein